MHAIRLTLRLYLVPLTYFPDVGCVLCKFPLYSSDLFCSWLIRRFGVKPNVAAIIKLGTRLILKLYIAIKSVYLMILLPPRTAARPESKGVASKRARDK